MTDEHSAIVAGRIKALRKALHLSQAKFGDALGVSRDVIANIEYLATAPRATFLDLIARIFSVNRQWLEDGTGEMLLPASTVDEELQEAARNLDQLRPPLRKYAFQQIRGLLELQNEGREDEDSGSAVE